jgi:Fe-S cluster assembly ATP-binding protein
MIKKKDTLEISNLHANIGDLKILNGINLTIKSGEIHAIMGPNGSGKSTLCNVLMGHPKYEVTKGSAKFNGKEILDLEPNERAHLGIPWLPTSSRNQWCEHWNSPPPR